MEPRADGGRLGFDELFDQLRSAALAILIGAIVGAGIGYGLAMRSPDVEVARTVLLIRPDVSHPQPANLPARQTIKLTLVGYLDGLARSEPCAVRTAETLGLETSQVRGRIRTSANPVTNQVEITYRAPTFDESVEGLQATVDAVRDLHRESIEDALTREIEELDRLLVEMDAEVRRERLSEAKSEAASLLASWSVMLPPTAAPDLSGREVARPVATGAFFGALLGFFVGGRRRR